MYQSIVSILPYFCSCFFSFIQQGGESGSVVPTSSLDGSRADVAEKLFFRSEKWNVDILQEVGILDREGVTFDYRPADRFRTIENPPLPSFNGHSFDTKKHIDDRLIDR